MDSLVTLGYALLFFAAVAVIVSIIAAKKANLILACLTEEIDQYGDHEVEPNDGDEDVFGFTEAGGCVYVLTMRLERDKRRVVWYRAKKGPIAATFTAGSSSVASSKVVSIFGIPVFWPPVHDHLWQALKAAIERVIVQ